MLWMRDVLKVAMESNLNVVMELYHVRKYKYRQNIYLCEFTRYQEGKLVRDWGKIVKSDTALLFLYSNCFYRKKYDNVRISPSRKLWRFERRI